MTLQEALPLIIPIVILEWTLAIVALIHVIKNPTYRFGNMPMWIVIVLFIQIIGPIVYFLFGRGKES